MIATSFPGIAACLRRQMHADDAFTTLRRVAGAVSVSPSADTQAGYGLPADQIVERPLEAITAGCNLEDSDHYTDAHWRTPAAKPSRSTRPARRQETRVRPSRSTGSALSADTKK